MLSKVYGSGTQIMSQNMSKQYYAHMSLIRSFKFRRNNPNNNKRPLHLLATRLSFRWVSEKLNGMGGGGRAAGGGGRG